MKVCTRAACPLRGAHQDDTQFRKRKFASGNLGRVSQCTTCDKARSKARREVAAIAYPTNPLRREPAARPDDFDIDVVLPEATPAELTREQLTIARLKADVSRLQSHARELEKLAMTADGMRDVLGSLGAPNVIQQPDWLAGARSPRSTTGTGVLFLSDIHFDEVVHPAQIGGCNEYNREIATRRLHNTFRNTVALLKGHMASPRYDGIVCVLGGDLLSGNIHEELTESNEAPIQVSMITLESILMEGIGGLADEFGKVHVPCVTGNHGRMHKKPRAKNRAFENFEWSVYQRLAAYFRRDNRITFDIPEGSDTQFRVYSHRFGLTHGDQFTGGGGIGGIMVPIMRGVSKKQNRQQQIGQPFDVAMMGHFHSYIHTNSLIINGSVKGYDEYAAQNNFSFEPPQQALFIDHPEVGMTFRMPVLCDKAA